MRIVRVHMRTTCDLHVILYLKGVGNKAQNASKMSFLRYSTGESDMIVELFSRRPFIKILFSHLTISISRFRIIENFSEISRKFSGNFPEISRKFLGNLPDPHPPPTTHPPCPPPPPIANIPEPPQNFKFIFLKKSICLHFGLYFPHPSRTFL